MFRPTAPYLGTIFILRAHKESPLVPRAQHGPSRTNGQRANQSLSEKRSPLPPKGAGARIAPTTRGGVLDGGRHYYRGGYAQLRGAQQVLTAKQGPRVTVPTMVFGGKEAPRFVSPHNDPLVFEMKITQSPEGSWKLCRHHHLGLLKEAKAPGARHCPSGALILGFGGQEVNPTGMIRLPLSFSDKWRARKLEVEFLVIDVPTAYNMILGHPTLHKVKVVIAPYLL
ncbi:hypothetical protein Cgig2_030421 [Carnegiea gigantea]|uniref:Uncharacterized protein n=1 Tax=Carnegiea gigantea TaxID=171969 RepID=A0A9Q1GIG5_9CARY|nr:hypothetical protein Cgig2_030421 [Carnegiea gigantea]